MAGKKNQKKNQKPNPKKMSEKEYKKIVEEVMEKLPQRMQKAKNSLDFSYNPRMARVFSTKKRTPAEAEKRRKNTETARASRNKVKAQEFDLAVKNAQLEQEVQITLMDLAEKLEELNLERKAMNPNAKELTLADLEKESGLKLHREAVPDVKISDKCIWQHLFNFAKLPPGAQEWEARKMTENIKDFLLPPGKLVKKDNNILNCDFSLSKDYIKKNYAFRVLK